MLRSGSSAVKQESCFGPMKRKRIPSDTSKVQLSRATAPLTPPEEDDGSKGSHSGTDGESDYKCTDMAFGDEEVEAASSLATFILAASASYKATSLRQPHSAPAAMCRSSSSSVDSGLDLDPQLHKKQRRREKNRASAQQSRQRKKCHLETLEHRVGELEKDRQALQAKLESLAAENQSLRTQLAKTSETNQPAEQSAAAITSTT